MPVKKAAKPKKTARGKKAIGLTSALGPKATTMIVCVVIAAGITVAARQQQARAKERMEAARAELAASPAPASASGTTASPVTKPSSNAPKAASATEPTTVAAAAKTPITVIGCLESTNEGFRLRDTSGDAPKARSWKSGFLKKSSSSIDVVDAARTLQLATHVGHRVSLTGTLDDRELLARSLRTVGDCKAN